MAQKNIETGVDKLLDIIERRKRLSINDAADELGVSVPVIQEWADFLEEEGLITIEYKLSKTYLCERKLNKGEVEKKAKEYSSKKDAFTRKVETALRSLQKESEGFEQIKEEFNKLKDVIGGDIDQVKEELQELKHYEDLKKNIDKDIMQQKLDFQEMLENLNKKISEQQKKHDSFIDEIGAERSKVDESKAEMSYLEKRGDNIRKRVEALGAIIKSIEDKIDEQKKIMRDALQRIESDLDEADKLQKDLKFKMTSELEPIMSAMKEKEEKILSVQDSVLKKMAEKNKEIDKYKLESMQAAEKFNTFFMKKAKTQELITSLNNEKAALEKELQGLIAKATSFNLAVKSSDVKDYVKDLQKSFDDIERKKGSFTKKLDELTDVISKKE
jgi:chromosome segregation ATPase